MDINTIILLLGLTPEQVAWLTAILGILFAVSEALALIPSVKSNSVFQLLSGFLSKCVKKGAQVLGLFCVGVFALTLLVGCAGPQTTKPYEIGKATAESILYEARVTQNTGKLSAADFAKIQQYYERYKLSQDFIIDTRYALVESYDADQKLQYDVALRNLPTLLKDLMDLAAGFGIRFSLTGGN